MRRQRIIIQLLPLPEEVVNEIKFTEDQAVNMQQTSKDLTGQLIDGAMVKMALEGPTQLDIGSKDLSFF